MSKRRRQTVGAVMVAATLALSGCALVTRAGVALLYENAALPAAQIVRDVCYIAAPCNTADHTLDLYLPTQREWPVIVFVHGGGWDSGDKNYRAGGADVYANIGRYYATRGIGVAVINYRSHGFSGASRWTMCGQRCHGCATTSPRAAGARIACF